MNLLASEVARNWTIIRTEDGLNERGSNRKSSDTSRDRGNQGDRTLFSFTGEE